MVAREMGAVVEPQVIEDEEHEQILERVAAIDVAKASGMVCTRVAAPGPAGPGAEPGVAGGRDYERGSAVASAGRTGTFLGQRYRRLARRRGRLKALVAVAQSILVIAWHLLSDRDSRFHDLGADYYTSRIDKNRETRSQLEALGYTVVLTAAA